MPTNNQEWSNKEWSDKENKDIYFMIGDKEAIRLSKDGNFYWKGKKVKDTQLIYDRFCKWVGIVTHTADLNYINNPKTTNNQEKWIDEIKERFQVIEKGTIEGKPYELANDDIYGSLPELIDFLRQEIRKAKERPMGVSEWEAHGKKYGYWDYFNRQTIKEILEEVGEAGKFPEESDEIYEQEEWGGWKIVSDMLDHPDKNGIYSTSICYEKLYEFVCQQKEKVRAEIHSRIAQIIK